MTIIITGGQARGRRIEAPDGLSVRPTGSKIRQALFNILGNELIDAHFLDIFAGTGLMGLEALSRGAASLVAIEENTRMVRAIESSLEKLGFEGRVLAGDFRQVLPHLEKRSFDIIFADPPYKTTLPTVALQSVERFDLLSPGGVFVVEHARGYKFPEELKSLVKSDSRFYGQTGLSFFRRAEGGNC